MNWISRKNLYEINEMCNFDVVKLFDDADDYKLSDSLEIYR